MKLFNLKEMINFYKIDPVKTSTKILKEFRGTAKQIKENQQREDKTYSSHENKLNASSEDAQIVIQNLIKPLVNVLIYLFSLYVIYAYSFILIFNSSKSDIVLTSKFASEYLQVDKAIMNSILLLQCILFSNQTDYSLNQYLKNYTTFVSDPEYKNGYIWDMVEDAKLSRTYLTWVQQNYPKFQTVDDTASSIAVCDILYSSITDDVFSITKKNFPGNSLLDSFAILCKHYPVTNEKY